MRWPDFAVMGSYEERSRTGSYRGDRHRSGSSHRKRGRGDPGDRSHLSRRDPRSRNNDDGAESAAGARVADKFGDQIVLGAGTVLDPETARACMLAGAEFLVTPSLNLATIEMAKRYSKVITPGALTPSEVLAAWQAGGDIIKIFPCSAVGGANYIKALRAPFPQIEMMPTGGVSLETVGDFLKAGACAVAVGAELIDTHNIREGQFGVFEERGKRFLAAIAKARSEMRSA
jgi:2-dehydro-3-deoxyphosphogluconate aldolase/(4S)-4-hydroxy-2-oxoglutarate aldolase